MTTKYSYILVTVPNYKVPVDVIKLVQGSLDSHVIDFYTMNMDELFLIAKHRILPRPTLIILNNTKIIGRFVGTIPSLKTIKELLNKG